MRSRPAAMTSSRREATLGGQREPSSPRLHHTPAAPNTHRHADACRSRCSTLLLLDRKIDR